MGTARDQAAAVADGKRTSLELVTEALDAAERLQPALNAFTMVFRNDALAAARAADDAVAAGGALGPLHGVPVAVKDLFDVAGAVTSGCCAAYRNAPPATADAPAVAALRRAGAVVIGKTNMHELAFGDTTSVSCYGPANNPWDPERMPGGSSGGSGAAVAAGIVGIALGSDTGGSVRIPSAYNGVSGLKTTHGLLTLEGVQPMSPSLDTVGALASDAEDLALALGVLTGEPVSPWSGDRPAWFRRLGVPTNFFFDKLDPEIAAAVRSAVEAFASDGVEIRDVAVPWVEDSEEAWLPIALAEFARVHAPLVATGEGVDPAIHAIMQLGASISEADEREARDRMEGVRTAFARTFDDVDALIIPTTPITPPRHTDQTVMAGDDELTVHLGAATLLSRVINTPGAPVVAVPCGFSSAGLPIGMSLVGPRGSETMLLGVGMLYQTATDHHTRVPPVHA